MKDLVMGGPYCSQFLLTCIFALAARHCSHDSSPIYRDRGERFVAIAKELWAGELSSSRPSIATIQGLLILGCRQCGVGNTSEGWLFSGMVRPQALSSMTMTDGPNDQAFRVMADIGLHLDPQRLSRYESLSPMEVEVRKRLAISAYLWDKLLSLMLGRPPTLVRLPISVDDLCKSEFVTS